MLNVQAEMRPPSRTHDLGRCRGVRTWSNFDGFFVVIQILDEGSWCVQKGRMLFPTSYEKVSNVYSGVNINEEHPRSPR